MRALDLTHDPWQRRRSHAVMLLAALALVLLTAGCGGDDEDEGRSLSFVAEGVPAPKALDTGERGKSPGDVYVFDNPLLDADEQETVGHVYGTQTSISLDAEREVVQSAITFDLGDGDTLDVGGISEYPVDDVGLTESQEFVRPVIGGTGEYAGASGTLTSVRRSDGRYEQDFQLDD